MTSYEERKIMKPKKNYRSKKDYSKYFLATIILFSIFNFTQAYGEGLDLEYTLTIENPSNHILKVGLKIRNLTTPELILARHGFCDHKPPITFTSAKTETGNNLSVVEYLKDQYFESYIIKQISGASLIIEYIIGLEYYAQDPFGGYSYWNLDSSFGAVDVQLVLIQPVDTLIRNCKIMKYLPANWEMVSRLIDKGDYFEPNIDDKIRINVGSQAYDFVIWGPLGFGQFDKYSRNIGGIETEIIFLGNKDLQQEISKTLYDIFGYFSETLGPLNMPPKSDKPIKYLYLLLSREDGKIVHSGANHFYGQISFISSVNPSFNVKGRYKMDAHIIAHTWFAYAVLLSNVIHEDNVFGDGIIQFYALKSIENKEIWTNLEVNNHFRGWYEDYKKYILGTSYDVPISPREVWSNFPNDPLPSLYSYGINGIFQYEKNPLVLNLLDWKIRDVTNQGRGLNDVYRYCHDHPEEGDGPYNFYFLKDILSLSNYMTGRDFRPFFDKYIYGNERLPFYVENDTLRIDYSMIPEVAPLTKFEILSTRFQWGDYGTDTDADGLSDELEGMIGTNPLKSDTDGDGLSDREEFGVIIDGKATEKLGFPIISDPHGDSVSTAPGTDIKEIHVNVFVDENEEKHLYLVMSLWDNKYNPEIWYEIFLNVDNLTFQYRFDHGRSYLWKVEAGQITQLPDEGVEGKFADQLEVKIPFRYLVEGNYSIRAFTRYDTYSTMPLNADETQNVALPLASLPKIFVTDPLKSDTKVMPVEGTVGTQITVEASHFGSKTGQVYIGTKACKVLSWTNQAVSALLSGPMPPGTYDVTVKPRETGAQTSVFGDAFSVMPPEIATANPNHGLFGEQIILTGEFFGAKKGKVYLGTKSCKIVSWTMDPTTNQGQIQFSVPRGVLPGNYDLKVSNQVGAEVLESGFTVD